MKVSIASSSAVKHGQAVTKGSKFESNKLQWLCCLKEKSPFCETFGTTMIQLDLKFVFAAVKKLILVLYLCSCCFLSSFTIMSWIYSSLWLNLVTFFSTRNFCFFEFSSMITECWKKQGDHVRKNEAVGSRTWREQFAFHCSVFVPKLVISIRCLFSLRKNTLQNTKELYKITDSCLYSKQWKGKSLQTIVEKKKVKLERTQKVSIFKAKQCKDDVFFSVAFDFQINNFLRIESITFQAPTKVELQSSCK